jgi:hypothetical protein
LTPTTSPADNAHKVLTQAELAILEAYEDIELGISKYVSYYRAAQYAAWEALLHFPNDPRVEIWRWKLAYYAALSGDTDLATTIYSGLIEQSLNEREITLQELPSWFQSGELEETLGTPSFSLNIQTNKSQNEAESSIIEISPYSFTTSAGSCFLVRKENQQYFVYVIHSGFSGVAISARNYTNCAFEDLTGDNSNEVVVEDWIGVHTGWASIQVFDISSLPPKALPFKSLTGVEYFGRGNSTNVSFSDGKWKIQILDKIGQLDTYIARNLEWNGKWFETKSAEISNPVSCTPSLVYYAQQVLDTQFTIEIIDQALNTIIPESDADIQCLAELQIEKGLLYLFANQPDEARDVFANIVKNPISLDNIWVEPVSDFLDAYQNPSDIYKACSVLTACDPNRANLTESEDTCLPINFCYREAFDRILTHLIPTIELDSLIPGLESAGIDIASNGLVDLDNDGSDELWFAVSPPSKRWFDIWIASGYPEGVQVFRLTSIQNEYPEFEIEIKSSNQTIIELNKFVKYMWSRDPNTNVPLLETISEWANENYAVINVDLERYKKLRQSLFVTDKISNISVELLEIYNKYDTCPFAILLTVDGENIYECGNYYYTIGLAADMSNNEAMATEIFTKLLELYSNHPMEILAESKLQE